jgi:D-alanyl-lipoteichoic acid acyltransferase DltB (MBOAT superfamily)
MLFNSSTFLYYFLPICLVGYYGLSHGVSVTAAKAWLAAASFVFYGWWNPPFVTLLIGSIAFNYGWSTLMMGAPEDSMRQKWLLALGIAANILLLAYFKYLFPFLGFLHYTGFMSLDAGSIILPLGISFFTFTQIGYLVDCQEGLVRERGLLNYILFVTFFPHLIAGPILHHREIMPQFANPDSYRFRADNLSIGATVFALGMFKKVIFADSLAPWVENGYDHVQHLAAVQSWSVILAYAMQLYFDFSGYSDMAIGLGIMFGIKLPLNFNSPSKAQSVTDFWQRWHMTLTRYLTLLLYNPLALSVARSRRRRGLPVNQRALETPSGLLWMVVYPTFTTMLIAGVWHGAGLQFVIFGLLHAFYLTVNHLWRSFRPAGAKHGPVGVVWRVALTFGCIMLAQIFFRANDTSDAFTVLGALVGLHGSGLPLPLAAHNVGLLGPLEDWALAHHVVEVARLADFYAVTKPLIVNTAITFGLGVIAFGAPNIYQILGEHSPALTKVSPWTGPMPRWRPTLTWAIGTAVLLFISTQYFGSTGRFLYFQF